MNPLAGWRLALLIVAALAALACPMAFAALAGPIHEVSGLSYSPHGGRLAIVAAGNASSTPSGNCLYVVSLVRPESSPALAEPCASRSAIWLSGPLRIVYAASNGKNVRLVARSLTRTRDGTKVASVSGVLNAATLGAIGARHPLVTCVGRRPDGHFELYLWDPNTNALSHWPIPDVFQPSLEMPPVISQQRKIVAIVSDDGSYFLAFKIASRSWMMPVTVDGRTWRWEPLEAQRLNPAVWHSGVEFRTDRFLTDEKSVALWVVTAECPMGAMPTPQGEFVPVYPDADLSPLDLDRTRERHSYEGKPLLSDVLVWLSYIRGLSSATAFREVALLYQTASPDAPATGRDCVLYTPRPDDYAKEKVVLGDGSIRSQAISISPDGRHVAVVRAEGEQKRVAILDTGDGRPLVTWDLSALTSQDLHSAAAAEESVR